MLGFDRKTWRKLTTPNPRFRWQDIIKTGQSNTIPGLGLESPVHSRVYRALVDTITKPPLSTKFVTYFDWLSYYYLLK